jgi:hypothetical protein
VRLRAGSQRNPVQGQLHLVSSAFNTSPVYQPDFGTSGTAALQARKNAPGRVFLSDRFRFLCVLLKKRKKYNLAARHYFSLLLFYDATVTLHTPT